MRKSFLILSAFLCYAPIGLANLKLASLPVGLQISTWNTAFGFELTNFSIIAGDDHTQVFSQLPTSISEPDYSPYKIDPSGSMIPVAIATKGDATNGTILVSYTITMTLPRVGWMSDTVSATNIPIIIQNGQLLYNKISTTHGNTTCELSSLAGNPGQYIMIYCWLSSPPKNNSFL